MTDESVVKPLIPSPGIAPDAKKLTHNLLALGSKKGDRAFKKEAKRQQKAEKNPQTAKTVRPGPPATNAKPAGAFFERGAGRRVGIDTVAVRFDGSVPWTPNVIEVATFGQEEGFSNEEKRSLVFPVFWCRQLVLAVAFAVSALVMTTVTERLFVLAVLLTFGLPVAVVVRSRIKRRNELPPWMLFADSALAVALAAVSPSHFFLAVILAAFLLIVGGLTFSPTQAGSAMVLAFFGLAAAHAVTDHLDAGDLVMLGTVAVLVPAVSVLAQRLRSTERQIHRKYLDLLGGLEAVAWEADIETFSITAVSPQVSKMFGFDQVQFLRSWREMIHPDDQELEEASRFAAVRSGNRSVAVEFRMIDAQGITRHIRNTIAVERDLTKRITRVRGVFSDVTTAHEAENTIRKQAQYDSLTGLPNRSLFNDQLQRRLADARATNETLSVHLLDLNGFKEVNDTLGHGVGDILLQQISGRLAAYLPDRSFVARLGGDEFAVVTYPSNLQSAQTVAEAIGASLQPPITVDDMTIQAGAAIGVAMYPTDGDSPAVLLRRADAAMYEAKQAGQLYVFAMPDDDESNVRRLQLLGELRASIASGDFQLFHQPKLDALSGQIVGTEGLIRWNHKQFGLLTPHAFVELSELSGLIMPLTRWIIEQGIRDLADWRLRGYSITVAINLSVRNFFDHDLPEFIAALLQQYQVPGSSLVLEITESEVMADRAIARKALEAFRSLGVKISIDDFGTGFSSLSQLQLMPIDEIKVDQSFVSTMLTNEQDYVIVRSIIDLAHNLSLEVVAEGAETLEQLRALRSLNADRVQGYVIGKPMPVDRFLEWMGSLETVTLADGRHRARVPASYLGVSEAEIPLVAGRKKAEILAGAPAWAPPHLPDRSSELVGVGVSAPAPLPFTGLGGGGLFGVLPIPSHGAISVAPPLPSPPLPSPPLPAAPHVAGFLPPVMSQAAAQNTPTPPAGSTAWLPLRGPADAAPNQAVMNPVVELEVGTDAFVQPALAPLQPASQLQPAGSTSPLSVPTPTPWSGSVLTPDPAAALDPVLASNPLLPAPPIPAPTIGASGLSAPVLAALTASILASPVPISINPALVNPALVNPALVNPALVNPALLADPALTHTAPNNPARNNPALAFIDQTPANVVPTDPAAALSGWNQIGPSAVVPAVVVPSRQAFPASTFPAATLAPSGDPAVPRPRVMPAPPPRTLASLTGGSAPHGVITETATSPTDPSAASPGPAFSAAPPVLTATEPPPTTVHEKALHKSALHETVLDELAGTTVAKRNPFASRS
jgi:diguanylate cyclase (GGDEF)-like protein/PAS domain S-box-containing protein